MSIGQPHSAQPAPEKNGFEKHGQNIISGLIMAGILWVGNSVSGLEKQAIRQEAQSQVTNLRYEQLADALKVLKLDMDSLKTRQEALALANASKKQ